MDTKRFDDLTQRLSSNSSRRRLLGGLASGLLAGLNGRSRARAASVKQEAFVGGPCKHHGRRCPSGAHCTVARKNKNRGRCECLPGLSTCGRGRNAACLDLRNDPAHCGSCDNTCLIVANSTCQGGRCCALDGVFCATVCGQGAFCEQCCSGVCGSYGGCGTQDCLAIGVYCPSGCTPGELCPGCCDGTCNLAGFCATDGCVLYGGECTDSAQCCNDVPCTLGLCRYD